MIAPSDVLTLLAAMPLAALGGTGFLKGMLGLAAWLRLQNMLVATTLTAFATSSPEMVVSSMAALSGKSGIGLGDALGSNVVNIALILGVALLFRPLEARFDESRRDFALALTVPALTFILALDGMLSRQDGIALLTLFAIWISLVTRQAIAHRRDTPVNHGKNIGGARSCLLLLLELCSLILAGRFFVSGASGMALAIGLHPFVIGATVVGVAAAIHPIRARSSEIGIAIMFGMITLLLTITRDGKMSRRRGLVWLSAYCTFVLATAINAL